MTTPVTTPVTTPKTTAVRIAATLVALITLLASVGCASVKPWERGYLGRTDMAWNPDPLETTRKEHVQFSKEASLGGGGIGGGGCGCN